MKLIKLKTRFVASLLFLLGPQSLHAGVITGVEVSIDRFQDESSNIFYNFNSDIFGTVSEFKSITLTSPVSNTYSLSLSPEGDQWGSGVSGSETDILAEFIDGIYSFDVVYTDDSTDTVFAELGGGFPIYPTSLSLTGDLISWDSWLSPGPFSFIELAAFEIGGTDEFFTGLSASATEFALPTDFLKPGSSYDLEVWFLTRGTTTSHKASVATMTAEIVQVPEPSILALMGLGIVGIGFIRRHRMKT